MLTVSLLGIDIQIETALDNILYFIEKTTLLNYDHQSPYSLR